MVDDIKNKILALLKRNPEGLTMLKIASLVGVHRNTIPRYLYELKGEEKVRIREVGPAKLFYPHHKLVKRVSQDQVIEKMRKLML